MSWRQPCKKREQRRAVCRWPSRDSGQTDLVSKTVRWRTGANGHDQTFNWTDHTGSTSWCLWCVLCWTWNTGTTESVNRQSARHERYRAWRVSVGIINRICTQEGRITPFWFCSRQLTAVTIKNTYPVPWMAECPDALIWARKFLKLHFNYQYWVIEKRLRLGQNDVYIADRRLLKSIWTN